MREKLDGRCLEFTGKIRPFYDALILSKIENGEPKCLQKFRRDCTKTLAKFEAPPKDVGKYGYICMKYKHLKFFHTS